MVKVKSNWKNHKKEWLKCERCDLYKNRTKAVLGRGKIPADVLIVGESPSESDDVLGKAFIGPSGKLLDDLIEDACHNLEIIKPRIFMTNLVACRVSFAKQKKLNVEQIKECSDRLNQICSLVKPKAIVMLGKMSQKLCPKYIDWDFEHSIDLMHPGSILVMDRSQSPLAIQRSTILLRDLFEKIQN